jgi:hypothetical protein
MKCIVLILILTSINAWSGPRDINEIRLSKMQTDFESSHAINSVRPIIGTWYPKMGASKTVFSSGKEDMILSWEASNPYEEALRGAPTLNITIESNREIKVVDYIFKEDTERYNFDENIMSGSLFFKGYGSAYIELTEQKVSGEYQTECRAMSKMKKLICATKHTMSSGGIVFTYTIYVR